jgi:hypothetical protein
MSSTIEQAMVIIHDHPRIDAPLLGVYEAGEPLAYCLRQLMLQVWGMFPTAYVVGRETFERMGRPEAFEGVTVRIGDASEGYLVAVSE